MLQMLLYFLSFIQQIKCHENTCSGYHSANINILLFVHSLSLASLKLCLQMLSALVNCCVDNVSRILSMEMVFKFPKVMQQHT